MGQCFARYVYSKLDGDMEPSETKEGGRLHVDNLPWRCGWQARISAAIDASCVCCAETPPEMLLHRFHHCHRTAHAWQFAKTLLFRYANIPTNRNGLWPDLTWQQCLIGSPLHRKLKSETKLWLLLRGSVLRYTWIVKNAMCFNAD
jgi:hypothetical protein